MYFPNVIDKKYYTFKANLRFIRQKKSMCNMCIYFYFLYD